MISRNGWVCATFAAAVLCAGRVVPAAASTDLSGVYSSIRYVEEAADDIGMEVQVITKPQPAAVVTICEGECWGGKAWRAVITGRQISFSVVEKLTDRNGKPANSLTLNFVGRFEGDTLVLKQAGVPAERLNRVEPATVDQALAQCFIGGKPNQDYGRALACIKARGYEMMWSPGDCSIFNDRTPSSCLRPFRGSN